MTQTLEISTEKLRRLLDEGRPVTVLDVRPSNEREEWSIPGSLHVDAYAALWRRDPDALAAAGTLPCDVPVVTVCAMGRTSLLAAEQLRSRGLKAVSLRGGMRAWSSAWNLAEVPVDGPARVIQVRRTGKGCLSYVVGSDGTAAVIDASVEPRVYTHIAEAQGWRIAHVLDTHVHADHLSRSRRLARLTGATLRLPKQDRVHYQFEPVSDGTLLQVGAATIEVLSTPGHTGESSCYLLDKEALFTGDTLFLESIGRPDLAASPTEARARAHLLYRSLRKIASLQPRMIVLPGHTGHPVPFDGQPLAATLGEVLSHLQILEQPEASFVDYILVRIPPTPLNYDKIVELNESGVFPHGDPEKLESGANRCAIA